MKRVILLTFLLAIGFGLGVTARGDEPWVQLFDGTSLKGWKVSERPEQWKVQDGAIVANGKCSHLFYIGDDENHPAEFKNFHARLELMTKPHANSGFYFHTKFQPSGWPEWGFECQVNNSHGDPVKTASIYHIVKNFTPPAPDDEWFTLEVIVKGNNVQTRVNDKIISDYTQPKGQLEGHEQFGSGTFALQAHDPGSTVLYRKIEVQRLPDDAR